jgi:ketosteroid isomerase-like protein
MWWIIRRGDFSDYNLFGSLKEALRGLRFTPDQEVEEATRVPLATEQMEQVP